MPTDFGLHKNLFREENICHSVENAELKSPREPNSAAFAAPKSEELRLAPTGVPVQTDDASYAADNKAMGILAYFGPLVFVPMFAAKTSKFARFHTVQGFNLFLLDVAYGILGGILSGIFTAAFWWTAPGLSFILNLIISLVWIAIAVLAIIGIVNAAKGEKKALPIIGKLHILDSFMKPSV